MVRPVNQSKGNVRKAAILIACLDRHSAERLFEQMGPEAAQRVRTALANLGEVSLEEQQRVMEDFLRVGPMVPPLGMAGIELDDLLARRLAAGQSGGGQLSGAARPTDDSPPADAPPFRFLHEAAGETLASFLRHEHPQTIAVVVSHLQPRRAADLLGRFDAALQVDVLRRIAELDEADPEVVRDVERELHSLLSNEIRAVERRSAGLVAVSAILAAAEQSERREILANLAARQPQFAARIDPALWTQGTTPRDASVAPRASGITPSSPAELQRPSLHRIADSHAVDRMAVPHRLDERAVQEKHPAFAFADLARLDPRDLNEVLKTVDPQSLLLALSGAPSDLLKRLTDPLSPRGRKKLERKLTALGPIRLRDVDLAQQRVAEAAAQLVNRGAIRFAARDRTLAAA